MPSLAKYRHQDVSQVPSGYKVRTVRAGKHQVRIAFPKSARKTGSGQLVSILHPKKEKNPGCGGMLQLSELSTLQIPLESLDNGFGRGFEDALLDDYGDAQNPDFGAYWQKFKAKLAGLFETARGSRHGNEEARGNPKKRWWVLADWNDRLHVLAYDHDPGGSGADVKAGPFDKKQQAKAWVTKHKQSNPKRTKRNLDEIDAAAKLAGEFKGSPAESVRETQVSLGKHRDDFAHLAWLNKLVFHPAYDRKALAPKQVAEVFHDLYQNDDSIDDDVEAWEETAQQFGTVFLVFDFGGDEIELVSTAHGEQLEFIGGNQQSFGDQLAIFKPGHKRDRQDLGDLVGITYFAEKTQFGDKGQRPYYHIFGEDGGQFPRAFWDNLNHRIVTTGGSYRLDEASKGIIN